MRTQKEPQGAAPHMRGLMDVLAPDDQATFHAILRAAPDPGADVQNAFFGHPYFISAFDLDGGVTLRLKTTPPTDIAQALAQIGDADQYSANGAMTAEHIIICFGLADWTGRLLALSKAAFNAFLDTEWPDSAIPPAERRMLLQLLIGLSPAQAATSDQMAYETKRTYVKLLCRRLNVSGQTELVSAVLGRLLIAINALANDTAPDQDPLHSYRQTFLPPSARVLQLLDGQGEAIKILDIGPQTGRPVLLAHPTILPYFSNDIGQKLDQLNLRLLMPLRPGVFDPQAKVIPPQDFAKRSLEGLALCKSLLAGQDAPVLGLSTGSIWAVRFAQDYPDLAPKLFLASVTIEAPKQATLLGRFFGNLQPMVADRPALVGLYIDFMLKRHKDPARFRAMNDRVFPPGTPDGTAMAWEFSQHGALQAYMHFYQASPAYLKADTNRDFAITRQDIAALPCSLHLMHGADNPRDDFATIKDLAATLPNARLSALPGAGQVLRGPNLDAVWDMIADSN